VTICQFRVSLSPHSPFMGAVDLIGQSPAFPCWPSCAEPHMDSAVGLCSHRDGSVNGISDLTEDTGVPVGYQCRSCLGVNAL